MDNQNSFNQNQNIMPPEQNTYSTQPPMMQPQPAPKKSRKTLFAIITVVIVLLVIGGVVFWLLQRKDNTKDAGSQANTNTQAQNENTTTTPTVDKTAIITLTEDQNITVTSSADIAKLDSRFPQSFKTYLSGKLIDNTEDQSGCINAYTIKKINVLNMAGGVSSVNAKTLKAGEGDCGGGAAMFWYYKDGTWNELGTQSILECKKLDETTIYSEFIETCVDSTTDKEVPNPNGSIKNANS